MKLEDKQIILNKIREISRYIYQFHFRYRDIAPDEWNPVLLFPHSMELIDPFIMNPDQSEKFSEKVIPWENWNLGYSWECLKKIIRIEMDDEDAQKVKKRMFITCERKSPNEHVIGFFDYDKRANTRLIIRDFNEFISLAYTKNQDKLEEETGMKKPTILNSDTLLEKTYSLIADYTLYPVKEDSLMWVCKIFNFKPKFSGLFKKFNLASK